MNDNIITESIPWEAADQLCIDIREEAEKNWSTAAARWCWSCQKTTGGDMNKRSFMRQPGNRGCYLINERFVGSRFVD